MTTSDLTFERSILLLQGFFLIIGIIFYAGVYSEQHYFADSVAVAGEPEPEPQTIEELTLSILQKLQSSLAEDTNSEISGADLNETTVTNGFVGACTNIRFGNLKIRETPNSVSGSVLGSIPSGSFLSADFTNQRADEAGNRHVYIPVIFNDIQGFAALNIAGVAIEAPTIIAAASRQNDLSSTCLSGGSQ